MKIETSRNTENTYCESSIDKEIVKRLPTTTIWISGTIKELDSFAFYIEEFHPNTNACCREVDGNLFSDFYTVDIEDVKDFKVKYSIFKKQAIEDRRVLKSFESNNLKVEQLRSKVIGRNKAYVVIIFKITINGEERIDRLDPSNHLDRSRIDYIKGSKNIAEAYYDMIV